VPDIALATITKVVNVLPNGFTALPEGMHALQAITLGGYRITKTTVQPGWLPASSAARVRSLSASDTTLSSVPSDMHALEDLTLERCNQVADDWLPDSSRSHIRTLNASSSSVRSVPENMRKLRKLLLSSCRLQGHWLPDSSAGRLQVLQVSHATMEQLPDCLVVLEELDGRIADI
jgi:Leucine-rich repeat (LRR) protein